VPRIRSTERPHAFSNRLFNEAGIFGIQNLTLDANNRFTAGVEEVDYDPGEIFKLEALFPIYAWKAKWCLCNALSSPFYLVTFEVGATSIEVYSVSLPHDVLDISLYRKMALADFVVWWASIKGTVQTKPLWEAEPRVGSFDNLLDQNGLAWGGNIDGFILSDGGRPAAIIETRYTERSSLANYDPADYFNYKARGGDYKTWEPLVLLAARLEIPLYLMTFERLSSLERTGFAVVDHLTKSGVYYRRGKPNLSIIQGVSGIRSQLTSSLSETPPQLQ
jgi:hypothetical protein